MNSLKTQILIHLRAQYPRWTHKGEILRLAMLEWTNKSGGHYESETAGRRCRDLEGDDKLIEKKENEKHEVMYRAIPIEKVAESPPKKIREDFVDVFERDFYAMGKTITLPPAFPKQQVANQQKLL